jgi:hypothetical protein
MALLLEHEAGKATKVKWSAAFDIGQLFDGSGGCRLIAADVWTLGDSARYRHGRRDATDRREDTQQA